MKICSKCNLQKVTSEFHRRKQSKDGLQAWCRNCLNASNKQYSCNSREQKALADKIWYEKNKNEAKNKKRQYFKKKLATDPMFRIACNLRRRMRQLFRQGTSFSAVRNMGCTLEELKHHLESQFTTGMAWDNYGSWHVDHKFPLSKADLTNAEELKKVIHFSNLQPLWAIDNRKKGASICQ